MKTNTSRSNIRPCERTTLRQETQRLAGDDLEIAECASLRMDKLTCRALTIIPHTHSNNAETRAPGSAKNTTGHRRSSAINQKDSNGFTRVFSPKTKMFRPSWALLLVTLVFASFSSSNSAVVPHNFNDLSESPLEAQTDIMDIAAEEAVVENPELSAKEFLGKFGYVRPAEWSSVSPRFYDGFRRDIDEGESEDREKESYEASGEDGEAEKPTNFVRWSFENISEKEYQRALIKYQRVNGLNTTGELDADTKAYMGRPRCGVPDRTASIKVNRTLDLAPETTATPTSNWINATTGYWVNSNSTDASDDIDSTPTDPAPTAAIHTITITTPGTSDEESSGDYETTTTSYDLDDVTDGSGDFEQDLLRRKRAAESADEDFRLSVGFEHGVNLVEDTYTGIPSMVDEYPLEELRTRQVTYKGLIDEPISEAELPDENRVSDMQGILEALRKEKLSKMGNETEKEGTSFHDLVSGIRPTPAAPMPGLVKRIVMEERANRRKRSSAYLYDDRAGRTGWRMAYPKKVITWRLVDEWSSQRSFMISNEIWFTIKLAFRMWSEIIPRSFREDNTSPASNVDILIGFGRGEHNRCLIPFIQTPFMHEYAHAWPLPQAEMHFNDDQPFVSVSWEPSREAGYSKQRYPVGTPISLLKVAMHEIGHTLGLHHKKDKSSVMNPVYVPYQSKKVVELESVDRASIQSIYGTCNIAFDAVFDWVRQDKAPDGTPRWKYNTFFFRNTWFWLYENRAKRPRYGDPKYTSGFWRDVLSGPNDPHRKIDGIVHIRDWSTPNGPIYFFTGDTFTEYDSAADRVKTQDKNGNKYPRSIKDGFPGIPYPIDTVFYKWQESLLYFFKDSYVYKFDWKKGSVVGVDRISTIFPGWGGAAPLSSSLDAAYYSYTDSAYYFFKGTYYWKLADEREKYYNKGMDIPPNAVGPRRLISSKWKYLCDVDTTEMQMTLPPEKLDPNVQSQPTQNVQVKSAVHQ